MHSKKKKKIRENFELLIAVIYLKKKHCYHKIKIVLTSKIIKTFISIKNDKIKIERSH